MLKRASALAAAMLLLTALPAAAGERVIDVEDGPSVDAIIDQNVSQPDSNTSNPGPQKPTTDPTLGGGAEDLCATGGLDEVVTDALCNANAGQAGGEDEVNAAALARSLRSRLTLPRPQMNTSPAAPVKTLVGLQTWLWVPAGQWSPLKLSATLGDTTVVVTARPIQSRWDMGEATTTCGGPGRVWRKGLGQKAKTTCGYTYKRTSVREPDDKYGISATMRYRITWTCEGDCSTDGGDLGTLDTLADNAQLEVGERQSVVIR